MTDARDRYLETAARLFADKGAEGASLAAIAGECGVTKQALLHFFGSKAQIYREVLERLAGRLLRDLDEAKRDDPAATLIAYFELSARRSADAPDDARLVARALLDGDPSARTWPLKPYLDALTALARATPAWRGATDEAAFAGVYQLIGAMQFFAISRPVIDGMYGVAWRAETADRHVAGIRQSVRRFVGAV